VDVLHGDAAERRWSATLLGLVTGLLLGVILMPGISLERVLYLALHGSCAQSHNLISGGVQLPPTGQVVRGWPHTGAIP